MNAVHIVVAMKPIEGNYAENALEHGVAGINVDESRVATSDNLNGGTYSIGGKSGPMQGDLRTGASLGMFSPGARPDYEYKQPEGRWPANVIHDGSDEVKAEFPDTSPSWGKSSRGKSSRIYGGGKGFTEATGELVRPSEGGSASRFFKECKA